MQFRKIPASGGRNIKVANYMIKIIATSDGTNCKMSLVLKHGPDGTVWVSHSTVLASVAVGTAPTVLSGDADISKIIGEWRQLTVGVIGVGTAQWAVVEIYEITKAF